MNTTFYQVSTLNALMLGNFDAALSVKDILSHGNVGLGTYEGLDGEAIFWAGKAYNGRADGNCYPMKETDQVAFGVVANFTEDAKDFKAPCCGNIEELKQWLDEKRRTLFGHNENRFYVMQAAANFYKVKIRSCYKQQKPYPTLSQVACDQKEYTYEDIQGYLVGIWCPAYVDGINMPGWHIHFLSEDLKHGGHVLDVSVLTGDASMQALDDYQLHLPSNTTFAQLDLTTDLKQETAKVEGNR